VSVITLGGGKTSSGVVLLEEDVSSSGADLGASAGTIGPSTAHGLESLAASEKAEEMGGFVGVVQSASLEGSEKRLWLFKNVPMSTGKDFVYD